MAVDEILAYLNATWDLSITYERSSHLSLPVFANADDVIKATDRHSIYGIVVMLGGAAVWAISCTQH